MRELPSGPFWLTLLAGTTPPVRVEFDPPSPKAYRAANRAAADALQEGGDEDDAGEAYSRELIKRGLRAWEGIGDAAGEVVEVNEATVEQFMADAHLFAQADRLYVGPIVARDAEKNASPVSPNGTSEEAGATAAPARKNAKSAPTGSTSPEAQPAT